jgi:HipA-like protein
MTEGDLRLSICRQVRIAPEDDFSLLDAIGGDCAGA